MGQAPARTLPVAAEPGALVALTAAEDFESLCEGLAGTLAAWHPGGAVRLYRGEPRRLSAGEILAEAGRPPSPAACRLEPLREARGGPVVATLELRLPRGAEVHPWLGAALALFCNQARLLRLATSDKLTGLATRDVFDQRIQRLVERLRTGAEGRDHVIAFIDIDDFKRINDNYGHLMGDEVLLLVAQHMRRSFRAEDELFRFGGEEFLVLLHNCDLPTAGAVLARFLRGLAAQSFPFVQRITASIGYTRVEPLSQFDQLVSRADRALYYVKTHGKNGCMSYEALLERGLIEPAPQAAGGDVELF